MTMPAIAPEARCEDGLEVLVLLDGLDRLGGLDGLDTGEDEDVVASALDQQMGSRFWEMSIP